MKEKRDHKQPPEPAQSPMPFDDALRKILASPPKHKIAAPKGKKKTGS